MLLLFFFCDALRPRLHLEHPWTHSMLCTQSLHHHGLLWFEFQVQEHAGSRQERQVPAHRSPWSPVDPPGFLKPSRSQLAAFTEAPSGGTCGQQVFSLHCVVAWQWEVEKIVRVDTLAWQRLPLQDLHAVALRPLFTKHATKRRLAAAFERRSTMKHVLFSNINDLQPTGNLFW